MSRTSRGRRHLKR